MAQQTFAYVGRPTSEKLAEHKHIMIAKGIEGAKQHRAHRCPLSSEAVIASHHSGGSSFILCSCCGAQSFMHRTTDRPAAAEFLYRKLGIPVYPLIYDRIWDIVENDKAFQQSSHPGDLNHRVNFILQQQLERANSFEARGYYGDMRVYRNIYSDDGKPNDVSIAVKYPMDNNEARQELLNETSIIAACEYLGGLRIPYLSGLVYDEKNQRAGIAMQYIHGINLEAFFDVAEQHGNTTRVQILHDILRTIVRLHKHGIIHNDLHLENVIIGENHLAYIVDFGSAKIVPNDQKKGCEQNDKYHVYHYIKRLFPDIDCVSTTAPQCVQSTRKHLRFDGKGRDINTDYSLIDALRRLATCTCSYHSYRDKQYFTPPLVVQKEKINYRDQPAFAPHDLVCPVCNLAGLAEDEKEMSAHSV